MKAHFAYLLLAFFLFAGCREQEPRLVRPGSETENQGSGNPSGSENPDSPGENPGDTPDDPPADEPPAGADPLWLAPFAATYTDGWLLGAFPIKAQYLDPADHPWQVWMQASAEHEGVFRVTDLYLAKGSPLSDYNRARAHTYIIIDASDPADVRVEAQDAGFVNPDIIPFTFRIAATGGTLETGADGTTTITLPYPTHNYDGGRPYPTATCTWSKVVPSIFVFRK